MRHSGASALLPRRADFRLELVRVRLQHPAVRDQTVDALQNLALIVLVIAVERLHLAHAERDLITDIATLPIRARHAGNVLRCGDIYKGSPETASRVTIRVVDKGRPRRSRIDQLDS